MSLKHKNSVLLIGFILLSWVCYKIPIKQTINAKRDCTLLKQEQSLFSDIPQQVVLLNTEKKYLDSILNKYQFSSDNSFQSNLLHTVTSFTLAHHLSVVTFEEPHQFMKEETKLNTFSFSIRGNFSNSLKLIYELEQVKKFGKILTVNFERKKNYRTNKKYLEATILLQRLNN